MVAGDCVVAGGCTWLLGGMHGCQGGMRGCRGACVVAGGMHRAQRDTVNEQAVRILLECILVVNLHDDYNDNNFLPSLKQNLKIVGLCQRLVCCTKK